MSRSLLYYPTFKLPSNEWLKNSLLYWDKVGTIVPERFWNDVFEDDTIKYLIDEDVYNAFDPYEAINSVAGNNMFQEFADRLDSKEFIAINNKLDDGKMFSIECDKISYPIWELLKERELIDSDFDNQILLKRTIAMLYMGVLAKYIAISNSRDHVLPSTNSELCEDLIFRANSNIPSIDSIALTLKEIIPKVHKDTSINKIIEFKKQRRDELLRFRMLIDDIHESLGNCTSTQEAQHEITKYKEQIELGVNTIRRQLSENKINNFVGTLRTIFSAKSPAWLGMFAGGGVGVSSALAGNPGAAIISTSLGIIAGAAIELANYKLGVKGKTTALEKESPYSYLYFAQSEGFIQNI